MQYALVNGKRVEEAQARIAADDRGFRFGDGVFETIRVSGGMPYLWDYHARRLEGGLAALRIAPFNADLLAQAMQLLDANQVQEGMLRIQVSRGCGSVGYLPDGRAALPTCVMQTLDRTPAVSEPVTLWLSSYEKPSPRALPVQFKLAQGLNSVLAKMEAADHGAFDALQLSAEGLVCEAAAGNIFWSANQRLYTPALACGAPAGIIRRRIIELAEVPVSEGRYTVEDLMAADSVILTNASTLATPVLRLASTPRPWNSAALAFGINNLINNDIAEGIQRMRESLARR